MNRSGDSLGTIRIDYGIVYLPVGVTDPTQGDPSVVTMATGSVRLQGGQVSTEFRVTISEDAFLEPRANFHVYLNSTTLTGGGTHILVHVGWMFISVSSSSGLVSKHLPIQSYVYIATEQ